MTQTIPRSTTRSGTPGTARLPQAGGYGEEVRDPADIGPALQRARESGLPSLINVWVDPDVYAPGTMNQTMYK
ncbi:MAG: hypothetical protein QOC67_2862 [Pseudonocardiales bacterium]|jgi:thiamine pyrophosphate-dependent acetolactate synthase large subunit-like protein|nr:putative TPP-requiring enzyme [Pseudonocardia sp.]MDT7773938.1 hypothetical protein [Pseudonocardiales bacterium]